MKNLVFLLAPAIFLSCSTFSYANEATQDETRKIKSLTQAFDKIKGCYWIKEDLLNPSFEVENWYPTKSSTRKTRGAFSSLAKKSPITSMITKVYDSHVYFHPETKKPMKEVYISLSPGNTHPGRSFQLVIDLDSYGVKKQEIRGNFVGSVLDRETMGKTDEELKEEAKKPEEPVALRQEFVASGSFSRGIRLLVNSTSDGASGIGAVSSLYSYVLTPAKREDCVNDELLDKGLPPPERQFR